MDKAGPNNLDSWLAENLNEMNRSVDHMLKLIGEDDDDLTGKKKPELISHLRGFHQMYQSLVENRSRLTEELLKTAPSELHLDGSDYLEASFGLETPFFTPNQKLKSNISGNLNDAVEISFNSGGGHSVLSSKEFSVTELSSPTSSDSEADSSNSSVNYDDSPPVNNNNGLPNASDELKAGFASIKEQHQIADMDKTNNILAESNERKYEENLKISIENEELRDMKLKLEFSENEVCRLRSELEKCEPVFQHAKNLENQLEIVNKDLEMKKTDINLENRKVFDLKNQIHELEAHVADSSNKIAKLMDELEEARESLKRSDAEIMRLHHEAGSDKKQILDLNVGIASYEARLSELDIEVQTLKVTMCAKQEQYSFEREQLESENLTLSEEVLLLNSKINDLKSRSKTFEEKLVQCEREKLKMEESKTAQEMELLDEMNHLKNELHEKRYQVEDVNREFDRHKHKYDMVMVERDELKANIHKLLADVSCQDDKVLDLERQLCQLHVERDELLSASRISENTVTDLKLQVDELQKEVASNRVEISDGAEAKREAIRQLCFSLDHYKTNYQELRQAVTSNKRHVVTS